METAIFVIVLIAVALLVLYLMLHKESESNTTAVPPLVAVETPVVVPIASLPVTLPPTEPQVVTPVAAPEAVAPPASVEVAEKPKRRKPTMGTPSDVPVSGVAAALAFLRQSDGLTTAFVLKEIFDQPVSRRHARR